MDKQNQINKIDAPVEWVETLLPEICNPKQWKTISTQELTESGYVVYGANGTIGYYSRYTHERPTLMITCRGASCGNLHISVPYAYINGNAMALDNLPENIIQLKYLFYALKSRRLEDAISGSAQPQITQQGLADVNFFIAPFAEQQQIAAKLDELLAQVDSIKTRLDAIPKIMKRFRQSVLAAAVSGKLTEDSRESDLLSNWKKTNVGEISIVSTGKTPSRSEPDFWSEGTIPWLTSASTGIDFCYTAEQYVTELAVKKCSLKVFESGTLLLAMYGEGKTRGQVTELKLSATCNQACAAIIVNEKVALRTFVKLRLLENYEETRKAASGGNQPNLNLSKVRDIPIFLPPLEEQTEIVRRVEQLFAYADQIEQRVKDAQNRVNNLSQAILAKAFRGELTADWRAQNHHLISGENSASALLAKIQSERNANKSSKKAK